MSNLAMVAEMMDNFLRDENRALDLAYQHIRAENQELRAVCSRIGAELHRCYRRISALESDLRRMDDALTEAAERNNLLEISILECENHYERTVTRRVRRNLQSELDAVSQETEVINLVTEEELSSEEEEIWPGLL